MSGSVSTWAATPADNMTTPSQASQSIDRLASAKQLDWQDALDPSVASVTRDDFLAQMTKADRVIKLTTQWI
jgi:hypothetical protein